jgi:hypothetical protein
VPRKKPGVRPVSGAGALDRCGNTNATAGLGKRRYIFLPQVFVEIDGEKPTSVFVDERVGANYVSAL